MEKQKFQIEIDFRSIPPSILWPYIATPSGLKEWFADEVTLQGKKFTFIWDEGTPQTASIVAQRTDSSMRLRWSGDSLRDYFEMKIATGEMTGSTSLIVTDFALPADIGDARDLWLSQLETLRTILGC